VGSAKRNKSFLSELEEYAPPIFYRALEQIESAPSQLPYVHTMRQAWKLLGLDGIFCVQNRPTIYFKEAKRIDSERVQTLHQKLWNQGTATLLIIILPKEVQVYSGLVPPSRHVDEVGGDRRLVETLERTAGALELRSLLRQVETGYYYEQHPEAFRANQAVDHFLLENLQTVRDELLVDSWSHRAVHTLLGRLIFVCYLVDRKIISKNHFERAGASDVERLDQLFALSDKKVRHVLGKLFNDLQGKFNGSMFVAGDQADAKKLSADQISCLSRFFQGEELAKKQRTLGFWGYDFSVIPVETISAIYEEFLAAEDPDGRKQSGAFYTKRHLAEFVVDTALEGVTQLHQKKCLDPACGSGIFLVILFSRMAESWRRENPRVHNVTRIKALIDMLKSQVCGVDKMETACRITCFSLYLTLLDQLSPPDIDALYETHGAVLPDILALAANKHRTKDGRAVVEGNFFDAELPVDRDFDLVIGNPPWVSRKSDAETVSAPEDWYSSDDNPYLADAPRAQSARRAWFMPNGELSIPFLWKAPLHLNKDGEACLLVPSKVLLNQVTNAFQEQWFGVHAVRKVIQLADLRFVLFENAKCPTTVLLYSKPEMRLDRPIEFLAPKVCREDPRPETISISSDDVKLIDLGSLIHAAETGRAPVYWKQCLWSTPRDTKLLTYLSAYPPVSELVGRKRERKRWLQGHGFKPWRRANYLKNPRSYGEPLPIWWKSSHKYIDAYSTQIRLVLTPEICDSVGQQFHDGLHRSPEQDIFRGPMVLFNEGFTKFAFCNFPVIFQSSLQSISGPREDCSLLKFLAAYLSSSLAKYFLFHTASGWGTERDRVQLHEVKRLPFPQPHQLPSAERAQVILSRVDQAIDEYESSVSNLVLSSEAIFETTRKSLDTLIYDYFGLSDGEVAIVEDTVNVIEPSSTPSSKASAMETLRVPDFDERMQYADTLCGTLNEWAKRGPWRVSATITLAKSQGMAMVTLKRSKNGSPTVEEKAKDGLDGPIRRMRRALREKRGGLLHLLDLKVFDGPEIHILKRLELRSWTRTTALNDADEIAAAILQPGE